MRWRAADLLAVCVQNNPYCQKAAMEMKLLPKLVTLLETDPSNQVKIKALYAISCEYPVTTLQVDRYPLPENNSKKVHNMSFDLSNLL